MNSFRTDSFKGIFILDIPPSGYRYILSVSIPNILADKKCPNSCIIINVDIIKKILYDAVNIEIIIKMYTSGLILNIFFIV